MIVLINALYADQLAGLIEGQIRCDKPCRIYSSMCRLLIMDLCLTYGVSTRNVAPMLRSILKELTGIVIRDVASKTFVIRMLKEPRIVSLKHIHEEMSNFHNETLSSDGTEKYSKSFHSSVLTCERGPLLFGRDTLVMELRTPF